MTITFTKIERKKYPRKKRTAPGRPPRTETMRAKIREALETWRKKQPKPAPLPGSVMLTVDRPKGYDACWELLSRIPKPPLGLDLVIACYDMGISDTMFRVLVHEASQRKIMTVTRVDDKTGREIIRVAYQSWGKLFTEASQYIDRVYNEKAGEHR